MMRRSVRLSVTGVAVAAALISTGCSGGGGSASSGPLEKTHIVVAAVPALDSAGVYIAQQEGLFAAQGLHVKIVSAITSADVIKAQLAGQYDVTSGAYPSYILANIQQHANMRVIAPGSDMAAGNQEVMVTDDSPIQSMPALKDKVIGVNALDNIGTLLINSLLSDYAIPQGDVHFKAIPFPLMGKAMQSGEINAAWLPEPYVAETEEAIGAQPIADADQGSAQGLPISGYIATQTWLNKYPHTAAAFEHAIAAAQRIASTDPGEVQRAMAAYGGVTKMVAATAAQPSFPLTTSVSLLQRVADLMQQFGMTQQQYNVKQMIR
jgi:NitT/TauT family transport system substrate-binding protein